MARVYCDRHHGLVDGHESEYFTAGFYKRAGWAEFFNEGEGRICDACMFADPRYIAIYGVHK